MQRGGRSSVVEHRLPKPFRGRCPARTCVRGSSHGSQESPVSRKMDTSCGPLGGWRGGGQGCARGCSARPSGSSRPPASNPSPNSATSSLASRGSQPSVRASSPRRAPGPPPAPADPPRLPQTAAPCTVARRDGVHRTISVQGLPHFGTHLLSVGINVYFDRTSRIYLRVAGARSHGVLALSQIAGRANRRPPG